MTSLLMRAARLAHRAPFGRAVFRRLLAWQLRHGTRWPK